MKSIITKKKMLRNKIKDIKNKLPADYLKSASASITNQLLSMDNFTKAEVIMCYLSFGNEVDTKNFIKVCQDLNKRLLVPVIVKDIKGKSILEASEVIDFENDLAPGTMGIMEPKLGCQRIIDPKLIDFIVIPGLAFDRLGNRLGYGGGYYDGFLARTKPECTKIAITFTKQIVEQIPTEEHDIPIEKILTEEGLIKINN